VEIRGHSDPTKLLREFVRIGTDKGVLTSKGDAVSLKDGSKVDLNDVKSVAAILKKENFGSDELKTLLDDLHKLSEGRADNVRSAVVGYAGSKGYTLDKSQIRAAGAGCVEPVVARVHTDEDLQKNRRVEFRIVKINLEATRPDFDY
jgi:hypothetical protein